MRDPTRPEYRTLSKLIDYIKEHGEHWTNPFPSQALVERWELTVCSIEFCLDHHQRYIAVNREHTYDLLSSGWRYQISNKVSEAPFGTLLIHDTDARFELELLTMKMAI